MSSTNIVKLAPGVVWALLRKPRWLQTVTQTTATWPSEEQVADWSRYIPRPEDDGAHPSDSPFYSEWWYFDAVFESDVALSVVFHLTDLIMPLSRQGSINISVSSHSEPVWHRFVPYDRRDISAASDVCDVRIGPNHCRFQEDGTYHVHMDEPDVQGDLVFTTRAVGWRPGEGSFRFGKQDRFFSWVVPQPMAHVEGTLRVHGDEQRVWGWGYHDHNWTTVSLLEVVSAWSWGRLNLGGCACVFADTHLSARYTGARLIPFALFEREHVLASSFLCSNEPLDPDSDFLRFPQSERIPQGWRLRWQRADEQLTLELTTQRVMERADLLSGSPLRQWVLERLVAHPYYLRSYVSAQGEWKRGHQCRDLQGHGIYEQISLRP